MNKKRYEKVKANLHLLNINIQEGTVSHVKGNKIFTTRDGYHLISVRSDKIYIHQIIMIAAGYDITGLTVNHKDGNKSNNSIHNLEPMTMKQQMKHAVENGLIRSGYKKTS